MVWFRVDDTLSSHPKVRAAGLQAMGLWAVAGAYSCQHLTEGHVPEWYVATWPQGKKLAARLVQVGLWEVTEDGWSFHQWEERQKTKEEVEAERAATRERQKKWRERRRDNASTNGVSNGVTDGVGNGISNAAPSHPIPLKEQKTPSTGVEAPSSTSDPRFVEFWSTYPRRVGKPDALRAFAKAMRRATVEDIVKGAQRYRDDPNREDEFTAHPATWLNRDGWEDDPIPARGTAARKKFDDEAGWAR